MTKDDIKVEVTDEMLTIQGQRKQEKEEKREGYYYGERAYGSFYRAIPLPEGTEPAKATAEIHNGVLEVTMPAPEEPEKKSRLLEVQEKRYKSSRGDPRGGRRARHVWFLPPRPGGAGPKCGAGGMP